MLLMWKATIKNTYASVLPRAKRLNLKGLATKKDLVSPDKLMKVYSFQSYLVHLQSRFNCYFLFL